MVPEEVKVEQSTNVKALFPEQQITTDKEKELLNYFATKLAEARGAGLQVDSLVFALIGTLDREDTGHPDGSSFHYNFDESRHVSKELAFIEKLIANEVNTRIDAMEEA